MSMFLRMAMLALLFFTFAGMALAESVKTSKERLSDKASDEQRLDDCRVPPERRNSVVRPDCQPGTATAAPTQPQASTQRSAR
jgi:hypothetical protein